LEADTPVDVTLLGECETKLSGRITNYSNYGLDLTLDQRVPIGAAIKVEWNHTLLLGEVVHCRQEGDGFTVGLELEHALYNTAELARLAKRLLDESPQEELPSVEVHKPR